MNCRSCESQSVFSIFSLGDMPLANRLLTSAQLQEIEPKYHLEIMLCEQCGLVQLKDIVEPKVLFNEYLYFSSNSETMVASAAQLVEKISPVLPKDAKIVEIASNDGYLLQHYVNQGFDVTGIEPARNIAEYANSKGINTLCEYFTTDFAEALINKNLRADVIHANNVMAHVPNINDFVAGIKTLLKPEGQAVIEVPYLLNLIEHCEFDTIYHEHVYYFSLQPLVTLFARHELMIYDVEQIAIHGGSLRLFITHAGKRESSQTVLNLLAAEQASGMKQLSYYENFAKRIFSLKEALVKQLALLKKQDKRIVAYGASAKGATLLNFFGIGREFIDYVVDRSPFKQGYFTPGTYLKIEPVELLLQEKVDYALLLTWNFADEILKQQQEYRERGGKFIIPIPNVEVV